MSDTPETDVAWNYFKGYIEPLQDVKELSRKLERERDEARFDLEFRRELYAVQELQLAEARKTIAELRHKTL